MPLSQLDPYWQTRDEATVRLYHGDALEVLERLPSSSVHCAVTSPPYWGLRDYLTGTWDGGDSTCLHKPDEEWYQSQFLANSGPNPPSQATVKAAATRRWYRPDGSCRCGATRTDQQIGAESHPDLYVSRLVEVFRELRRVLRDDGTFWLNLGSSSASGIIESEDYVIREDLTDEEYNYASVAIAKALSSVQRTHASAEHSLPAVLVQSMGEATELSDEGVSEMREGVSDTQVPNRDRAGKVLLSKMCSSRLPGSQEEVSNGGLPDMRDAVQQVYKQPQKESRETELLQQGLLVCIQPEGQSLPMDRGPRRQDEPGGAEVAKGSSQKGQTPLPSMSLSQQTGSTSYNAVRNTSRCSLGTDKRDYLVPQLPRKVPRVRNESSRDVQTNCNHKSRIVITLRKKDIPPDVLRFFRPVYRLLPGNDIGIPWRVAFALQADGWILRQEIIWSKSDTMPESMTNRCTKSHEYLFMFVKKAGYFFDQFAIREKSADFGTRNKRSVWMVSHSGYKGSHFSVFPPSLILPCIKAGTSEKGCCTECGAPWKRVVERTRTPTRPGENSKTTDVNGTRLNGEVTGNRDYSLASSGAERRETEPERHVTSLRHLGWYPSCKCYGLPSMLPTPSASDSGYTDWVKQARELCRQAEEEHGDSVEPCVVLDPFIGSGTTAVVCVGLGRYSIGIDLSEEYLKKNAIPRIEGELLGRPALANLVPR
jgi:DNA modification methylase